ncbi:uncharacterized protein A1O9_11846 [Exophiala aquamarina CBS 119918]|uniref:Uncharacterized protein n=1 Tax=Exophiala aquamarina CBS 119918 TaxID=1182545 RepID=A0A072NWH3_9EURO|nr:uncharacterized protein A1O9_11846 [Exophiala aquamarina CBS 119918]KEF52219.1 hypothetical protein A1O9_11846 [Exophiala aquamarina CBS 119918]
MPDLDRRRPRVATCEDWDEDAETTLPGSRTTANVSIKRSEQDLASGHRDHKNAMNGVDSGYVSRADTLVSEPTSVRRRTNDLKIETGPAVLERERQPYHMPQSAPSKPSSRRQSSLQLKGSVASDPRPAKAKQVHDWGTCQICDRYGWHDKDKLRAVSMAPPQPPSPTATRATPAGRAKDDAAIPTKTQRSSSMRQPRPLSVVTNPANPPQYPQQPIYATPVFAPSTWATPATPVQYAQPTYTYAAQLPTPTSGPPQYAPYQPVQAYFDPVAVPEPRSAKPSRRSSPVRRATLYGDPVINQAQHVSFPVLERIPSRESRPTLTSHKSNRSTEQDRIVMPPPPKPQTSEPALSRRPSARRAKAYIQDDPHVRERPSKEPLASEQDYEEYVDLRPTTSQRARRESPSCPPNSYRAPAFIDSRPILPRKSVSYSTTEATTKVASSKSHQHRRTTLPSVPLEQKEADAEAYQRKRGSATPHLTLEALRGLEKGSASSRSETGSSYSHKSHQSSSKDSSRGRSQTHHSVTTTTITLPGGLNVNIPAGFKSDGRPLSINVGDLTFSVNSQEKETERPREQKRIERAPSVASKTSRRSIASSNVSSNDGPKKTSRRTSQLEERVRPSRQHSRTPSTTGQSYEYTTTVTSRRQSADLGNRHEDYYGA